MQESARKVLDAWMQDVWMCVCFKTFWFSRGIAANIRFKRNSGGAERAAKIKGLRIYKCIPCLLVKGPKLRTSKNYQSHLPLVPLSIDTSKG